jgi:serine phosphatase RsbU (regulator of sigma subunit)
MAGALPLAPTNRRVSVVNADTLAAVAAFLRGSHLLAPHDLPKHVADHGEALGFAQASMYLADLQQQVLVPFLGPGEPSGPDTGDRAAVLAIDSTLAGRVFQHVTAARQDQPDGRVRVWTPLLDGSERLGVLAVTVDGDDALDVDHPEGQRLRLFATLLAELVMSKTLYGDSMVRLRRTADMGLAAEIQWNLLPPLTFASPALSVAAALEPAYEVAGDNFDYAVEAEQVWISTTDAMGHGLRAAMLASLAVNAIRNSRRGGGGLLEQATLAGRVVAEQFGGADFLTGLLLCIDLATGRAEAVNAGHGLAWRVRDGAVEPVPLEADPPLGPFLEIGYRLQPLDIEPGDRLVVVSDGVLEAGPVRGDGFGADRLGELLHVTRPRSPTECVRLVVDAVTKHQQGDLRDDVTVVCLDWFGPG